MVFGEHTWCGIENKHFWTQQKQQARVTKSYYATLQGQDQASHNAVWDLRFRESCTPEV
jgi:hypothetical protein